MYSTVSKCAIFICSVRAGIQMYIHVYFVWYSMYLLVWLFDTGNAVYPLSSPIQCYKRIDKNYDTFMYSRYLYIQYIYMCVIWVIFVLIRLRHIKPQFVRQTQWLLVFGGLSDGRNHNSGIEAIHNAFRRYIYKTHFYAI